MTDAAPMKVLHVEDSIADALLVKRSLSASLGDGVEVRRVERIELAEPLLTTESFDSILLDLGMPDSLGVERDIERLKSWQDIPVVVLTGHDAAEVAPTALAAGSDDVLSKSAPTLSTLSLSLFKTIERAQASALRLAQLEEVEAFFRGFMQNSTDALVVHLRGGRVLARNAPATRLWTANNIEDYRDSFDAAGLTGEDFTMALCFGEDGETEEFHEVRVTAVNVDRKDVFVSIIRDVTLHWKRTRDVVRTMSASIDTPQPIRKIA
ncbi:response regulator [Maricaulis sp. CAU 1757]